MQIVHEDYLFEIDESGYFSGQCYEGALGVVLKIGLRNSGWRALKLPRVLADSDRENYFIAALMADELKNAGKVGAPPELLALESNKSLLQRMATTGTLEKPLRQMLLAQLPKARRPRFCAIVFDHEGNVVELRPDLPELQWLKASGGEWRKILGAAAIEANVATHCMVIGGQSEGGTIRGAEARIPDGSTPTWRSLEAGRPSSSSRPAWFLGLPTPVYHWWGGTLEQAVRIGARGSWPFKDHLHFIERIANGLDALYQFKLVHCDLRPANIMFHSQPKIVGNYRLIDYATFGEAPAIDSGVAAEGKEDQRDRTVLGGGVAEARQSPFYAPERRVGRESEDCDTVLTLTRQDVAKLLTKERMGKRAYKWLVHAGFRAKMFTDIAGAEPGEEWTGELRDQIDAALNGEQRPMTSSLGWRAGDRVRVRDFVFEIETVDYGPAGLTFLCSKAWLVYSNRVFVPLADSGSLSDAPSAVHAVSRLMVLQKWSAATDLYSLGVLLLYSLFYNSSEALPPERQAHKDSEFANMIAVLSSPIYARAMIPRLWVGVDLLRTLAEKEPYRNRNKFPPDHILRLPHPLEIPSGHDVDGATDSKTNVEEFLKLVANSFASSTPGLSQVLLVVNRNVAHFILALHVVLALMHRREDFDVASDDPGPGEGIWREELIARNRVEEPSGEVIARVRALLERVQAVLNDPLVNEIVIQANKITQYEPASEATVILERQETQRENEKLNNMNESFALKIESIKVEKASLEAKMAEVKQETERLRQTEQDTAVLAKVRALMIGESDLGWRAGTEVTDRIRRIRSLVGL